MMTPTSQQKENSILSLFFNGYGLKGTISKTYKLGTEKEIENTAVQLDRLGTGST